MAREAGFKMENSAAIQAAENFAELVRADERNRTWTPDQWTEYERSIAAAEREACAKLCETGVDTEHPIVKTHIIKDFGASTHLASAIRARGNI